MSTTNTQHYMRVLHYYNITPEEHVTTDTIIAAATTPEVQQALKGAAIALKDLEMKTKLAEKNF